tara:strand:- start:125 stop:406 length:282 start_codon:yes stop_codon:yes gene_type:complete
MDQLKNLKVLVASFFKWREPKEKKMIRVFQWRRYLEWSELSPEEKLSTKRFLLIPFFAFFIIEIFNQNLLLIVLLLFIYVLYKKFEKERIIKK